MRTSVEAFLSLFGGAMVFFWDAQNADVVFQEDRVEVDSVADSEISMAEARRRIHELLDDTFSALKTYEKKATDKQPRPPTNRHLL